MGHGGAGVVGAMRALAGRAKAMSSVSAGWSKICRTAMPGPGDVVTTMSGQTVEV